MERLVGKILLRCLGLRRGRRKGTEEASERGEGER